MQKVLSNVKKLCKFNEKLYIIRGDKMQKEISAIEHIKVLYLEDDQVIKRLVSDTLKNHINQFMVANNGEEGLAIFRSFKPDLVITDLQMPKVTGIEFIQEVRKEYPQLPIIVTSGVSDVDTFIKSIELKVDKYIIKPFAPEELISAIQMFSRHVMSSHFTSSGSDFSKMPAEFVTQFLTTVRNFISSYYKEVFGKGASRIVTQIDGRKINVTLHEPFSSYEYTLAKKVYDPAFVNGIRKNAIEHLGPEMSRRLSYLCGLELRLGAVFVDCEGQVEKITFDIG